MSKQATDLDLLGLKGSIKCDRKTAGRRFRYLKRAIERGDYDHNDYLLEKAQYYRGRFGWLSSGAETAEPYLTDGNPKVIAKLERVKARRDQGKRKPNREEFDRRVNRESDPETAALKREIAQLKQSIKGLTGLIREAVASEPEVKPKAEAKIKPKTTKKKAKAQPKRKSTAKKAKAA